MSEVITEPKVFHYETAKMYLHVQLSDGKFVEFIGRSFTTDNGDTANKIESTKQFQNGSIWKSDAIKVAKAKKRNVRSGAKGTS